MDLNSTVWKVHLQISKYLGQNSFCQWFVHRNGIIITEETRDDLQPKQDVSIQVFFL